MNLLKILILSFCGNSSKLSSSRSKWNLETFFHILEVRDTQADTQPTTHIRTNSTMSTFIIAISPSLQTMHEQTQAWMHQMYIACLKTFTQMQNIYALTWTHTHSCIPIPALHCHWCASSVYRSTECWFVHYLHFHPFSPSVTSSCFCTISESKWKSSGTWYTEYIQNGQSMRETHL